MTESNTGKPYGTVLIKANEILDYLLHTQDAPSLAQISAGLGMAKPTAQKILTTMNQLGMVRRDDQTKRYYIGTQMIAYAQKAIASFDIAGAARPFLQKLRDETGETINLGVLRDSKIVLIEKLESPTSIKLQSIIGGTMNLYSSAMGKAVLATYTQSQLRKYFDATKLTPLTPYTITSQTKLQADLKQIQQTGVSIDNEENESEVFCLGATIHKNHQLYGAFSISTPKYRLPKERRTEFVRLMLNTQHAIEAAL
ncbi:IclR family transcriptional regulator [Lacticaseibacillus sp. 53-4]|uniref:IclR family transcriptional regulator n=1 Tax=Lacticaseibacillus sp. 53-4 TaxID=2799575 RepID=UPI0019447D0A|nr:IclR family transcriptional regulator [Lacticaseibacillus sp. 53-4]